MNELKHVYPKLSFRWGIACRVFKFKWLIKKKIQVQLLKSHTQGNIYHIHAYLDNTLRKNFIYIPQIVEEKAPPPKKKKHCFNFYNILEFAYLPSLKSKLESSFLDTHNYNLILIQLDDQMWCVNCERLKIDLFVCLYQDDLH